MAFLPNVNLGVPWITGFSWKYVNYTILVFPAALILLWILLARLGQALVHRAEAHDRRPPETPHRRFPERQGPAVAVSASDGTGLDTALIERIHVLTARELKLMSRRRARAYPCGVGAPNNA